MAYQTILTHEADGILTITLNRPARRNALTAEMIAELTLALEAAETSACGVVVLTGSGTAFCAGLDLAELQAMNDKSAEELEVDARRIARFFRVLYDLSKPTIASVNGHAIAGGTGLATLCDFTLAVPEAKFGYTEVKIGFVPAIVSVFLCMQVGEKIARDLLLTGRLFDSVEAQRLGLVTEVVAADELQARVQALAAALLANSPQSLKATKQLLSEQNRATLDEQIAAALAANAEARKHADFREGVAAFLEKRKPVWSKDKAK